MTDNQDKNNKKVKKMDERTNRIVMTGIMTSLIMVATMIIRIHIPFTQGYVHLGDAVIFLAVLVLGKKYGTFAAGVGSALADLLSGYAYYAPWTFAVKALMAFVVGAALEHYEKKLHQENAGANPAGNNDKEGSDNHSPWLNSKGRLPLLELLAMFFGGVEMTVGYYISASLMQGNWYTPLFSIPGNIAQFIVGMVIAIALATALYKTPARKYFAIK